jgi:two-component system LytT family response regulator
MLKAVIIDDKESAIKLLAGLLTKHSFIKIKIAGTALNLKDGVDIIRKTQPDIVFLEINLPGRSGLEIYKLFKSPTFKIIFCTANHQYAIDIIRISASGYLQKPINNIELQNILHKIDDELLKEQKQLQMEDMISLQSCPISTGVNILLEVDNGFIIVNTRNIEYCYGKDSCSVVVMNSQKEFLINKSLKELQAVLTEKQFYKPNKTHLANIHYTQKFVRSKKNYVVMDSGIIIPVSVRLTSVISKNIKGKNNSVKI